MTRPRRRALTAAACCQPSPSKSRSQVSADGVPSGRRPPNSTNWRLRGSGQRRPAPRLWDGARGCDARPRQDQGIAAASVPGLDAGDRCHQLLAAARPDVYVGAGVDCDTLLGIGGSSGKKRQLGWRMRYAVVKAQAPGGLSTRMMSSRSSRVSESPAAARPAVDSVSVTQLLPAAQLPLDAEPQPPAISKAPRAQDRADL